MQDRLHLERRKRAWAGLLCAGIGVLLLFLFIARPEDLKVPPTIAYLGAASFVLAGAALLLQAGGRPRVAAVFSFLVIAALTGVGGWIGFGAGPRRCAGSIGGFSFLPEELVCRIVFGTGAVLAGLIGLVLLWSIFKGEASALK